MTLRRLTTVEREYLLRLLELDFPGRTELLSQVPSCLARTISRVGDHKGTIELHPQRTPPAPVRMRVPVTATAPDEDGLPIVFLLHVQNGLLRELEVLRDDGQPIVRLPEPEELRVEPAPGPNIPEGGAP